MVENVPITKKEEYNLLQRKSDFLSKKIKGIDIDPQEVFPLSEEERALVKKWREDKEKAPKSPAGIEPICNENGEVVRLSYLSSSGFPVSIVDQAEIALASQSMATGSTNKTFAYNTFMNCVRACGGYKKADDVLNSMIVLEPQDAYEGKLISTMTALHEQGMSALACASQAETIQAQDSYTNRATKLLRLYNETQEALLRYRRRGEQRVVVQHVNVDGGSQAIVNNGNMTSKG